MNLKHQLCAIIDYDNGFDNMYLASKCEKAAEDFAIGFAEWIFTNGREIIRKANEDGLKSTKELLEIYKKEKGL